MLVAYGQLDFAKALIVAGVVGSVTDAVLVAQFVLNFGIDVIQRFLLAVLVVTAAILARFFFKEFPGERALPHSPPF